MRQLHKWVGYSLVAVVGVVGLMLVLSSPALAQPRPMTKDIFTPLVKGYDFMKEGKFKAAQFEFEKVTKADPHNPFAYNNMAVIMEKEGKLQEALSYLLQAQTHAAEYYDKVQQTCLVGGLCYAARPIRKVGKESTVAPIIEENIKRVKEKMGPKPKDIPAKIPPMEKK